MIASEMNLYPNRERGTQRFYAVQGEAQARALTVNLYDSNGTLLTLTNCRVFLYVVKPDRTIAITEGELTAAAANQVRFTLPYQACTCAGLCDAIVQVIGKDFELRFDSLELMVTPTKSDEVFESTADLSVFTRLIRNSDNIDQTLTELRTTKDLMVSVLKNYADDLQPDVSGKLPIPTDDEEDYYHESVVAADLNGNILMLDTRSSSAANTYFTCDEGATWEKQSPEAQEYQETDSDSYYLCVGGKQFLCVGNKRLVWVKINNGIMTIEKTVNVPYTSNVHPAVNSGKYVGGKYFLFFTHISGGGDTPMQPMYFTSEGATGAYLALPVSNLVALDIAFADSTWYILARTAWKQDTESTYYLFKSDDLANWTTVHSWTKDTTYKCFTVRDGYAMVYPWESSYKNSAVYRICLSDGTAEEVYLRDSGSLGATAAVSSDLFDVVLMDSELAYTKDGKSYRFFQTDFPENFDFTVDIAIPRRRLIVADGAYYAIYRLDMIGENLSEKLNTAKANLEALTEATQKLNDETVAAAQRVDELITVGDTEMVAGDALEHGHVYFWVQ